MAGVHADPFAHITQFPALHTRLFPHDVPFGALPVARHTELPVAHEVAPVLQMLPPGVHATPAAHVAQLPDEHTRLIPHDVPLARFAAVSVHVGVPLAHESVPAWHTLAGTHAEAAAHVTQLPALQTMLFPHEVPLGAFAVTAQVDVPVAHDVCPTLHTALGVQALPAVQAAHAPALQTWSVPHEVPLDSDVPMSVHVGVPP